MHKKTPLQSGFTLIELLVSVGIFIVVFISMTQIFFLMQGTIARINAQREMVAWLSTITQTISTDLENFSIHPLESDAKTLALTNEAGDEKVLYRLVTAPASLTGVGGSSGGGSSGGNAGWSINREVTSGGKTSISEFTSPLFYLDDIDLRVTPEKSDTMRCSLLPAATLRLSLKPRPENKGLGEQVTKIQTTFSSNANPLSYAKTCQ